MRSCRSSRPSCERSGAGSATGYGRVAISVPGTVAGTLLTQASSLGWHDIDLGSLWPRDRSGRSLVVGNDASFAAVAEARKGSASEARTSLHLFMDAGIGGALVERGRLLLGASGMAGEFGHLPFGDPGLACGCGASGCWNTALEPAALARALGQEAPAEGVSYFRAVLAQAAAGGAPERAALAVLARSLGRGAAGLVNALDPDVVTVGGLGRGLVAVAGEPLPTTPTSPGSCAGAGPPRRRSSRPASARRLPFSAPPRRGSRGS